VASSDRLHPVLVGRVSVDGMKGTYTRHDPPMVYQVCLVSGMYKYQIPVGPQHDTRELADEYIAGLLSAEPNRTYRVQRVVRAEPERKK